MSSSLGRRPGVAAPSAPLPSLPLPSAASRRPPAATSYRLTWTFAFFTLFALCVFFLGHVVLSSWLVSDEHLPSFRSFRHSGLRRPAFPASDKLKRILVMGSHHTGTSIVTRLLIEMGAYAGDSLLMLPGNELKYNEHGAAVHADKRVLSHGHSASQQRRGPLWVDFGFNFSLVPDREAQHFFSSIHHVVSELEEGAKSSQASSWVLKDPRISLLARHWTERLPSKHGNNICVIVSRDPLETSTRLAAKYNVHPGASLEVWEWMELWTESMFNAVHYCVQNKFRVVFAQHAQLGSDPLAFTQRLERAVFGEVKRFTRREELEVVLGGDFHPPVGGSDSADLPVAWSRDTTRVWEALRGEDLSAIPNQLSFSSPARQEAYATIITGDDKGFVAGALALGASIRRYDSERTLIAMLSPEVDSKSENLRALALGGWQLTRVTKLEEPWYETHEKCRDFTESQKVRWGRMFTKLRVFSLSQFRRVLYLDTDVVALRELEYFFSLQQGEFFAERSPSHRGVNAGIMLIRPSPTTLEALLSYARHNEPRVFWPDNQVGCTEQELVNRFFHGESMEVKLNNTRHFDYLHPKFTEEEGREENVKVGARLAHCLTTKCFKPWEVELDKLLPGSPTHDLHAVQSICDPLMYLVWYEHFLSDELSEARKVLGMEIGGRGLISLAEVKQAVKQLAGEGGRNFRRDWRNSKRTK